MRNFVLLAFLSCAMLARAQDQERRLVDRLLKPDTTLRNSSQDKKFVGERTALTRAEASTHAFYVAERNLAHNFADQRTFATTDVHPATFGTQPAVLPPKQKQPSFATKEALAPATATGANNTVPVSKHTGNRTFVAQGKSQKFLDRRPEPMTIEQVRELLNKNK